MRIEIGSLFGSELRRGLVEIKIDEQRILLDVAKAREINGMLTQAIEAAISDELLVRFLTEKVGLDQGRATLALRDFRIMRQGGPGTVYVQ